MSIQTGPAHLESTLYLCYPGDVKIYTCHVKASLKGGGSVDFITSLIFVDVYKPKFFSGLSGQALYKSCELCQKESYDVLYAEQKFCYVFKMNKSFVFFQRLTNIHCVSHADLQ